MSTLCQHFSRSTHVDIIANDFPTLRARWGRLRATEYVERPTSIAHHPARLRDADAAVLGKAGALQDLRMPAARQHRKPRIRQILSL